VLHLASSLPLACCSTNGHFAFCHTRVPTQKKVKGTVYGVCCNLEPFVW